jgi:prepilin-type N-terminal cleavage/methylation domain-containing protein
MGTIKRQDGFSLTELIVALAVLAILIGAAAPSFFRVIEKERLELTVETVIADFNFFRQEGLKRRVADFSFNFNDGTSWCYGIAVGTCSCSTVNSCAVRQVTGSDFNGISAVSSSAARYSYDWVRGTVTAGTITFNTPSGYDLRIVINGLGRASICSPSDNIPAYQSC